MSLKNELQEIIGGEIYDDEVKREEYSRDASLFEVKPQLIVAPQNVDDIKHLVKFVVAHPEQHLNITPRGGGTDMTGGPLGESIILDVAKHLNHIKSIDANTAVVEPGMFYRDFEHETLAYNALMPSYPASREICTVGGMVANNAGGEKTLTYGKTANYVEELKVVLRDGNEYTIKPLNDAELEKKLTEQTLEGEVYRNVHELLGANKTEIIRARPNVTKNSAGYALWNVWNGKKFDLTKLFVGSQGTLGIITEITFALITPKPHSTLLVIFLHDLRQLGEIVKNVLCYKPESFESFDDHTLKITLRYLPTLIKLIKPKNIFSLFWSFLPEFFLLLRGGVPKLILLAEFTGNTLAEAQLKAQSAKRSLKNFNTKNHITKNKEEMQKYWTMRRESFNLLRHHLKNKRTAPFIDDVIVRAEMLPKFLPKLETILSEYHLTYTIAGHVGDGNFHIIPLIDPLDKKNRDIIFELSDKVYKLVFEFGGSMTAEHNDGLIRSPYLRDMYGEHIYGLFIKIKNIFDPQNIFNPHKKIGATKEFAIRHLQ